MGTVQRRNILNYSSLVIVLIVSIVVKIGTARASAPEDYIAANMTTLQTVFLGSQNGKICTAEAMFQIHYVLGVATVGLRSIPLFYEGDDKAELLKLYELSEKALETTREAYASFGKACKTAVPEKISATLFPDLSVVVSETTKKVDHLEKMISKEDICAYEPMMHFQFGKSGGYLELYAILLEGKAPVEAARGQQQRIHALRYRLRAKCAMQSSK